MKKHLFFILALLAMTSAVWAQRRTDRLDRGLVAVPANVNGGSGSGLFNPNDDWDVIRRDLLTYDRCEEVEDEDILDDFDNELDGDKADYILGN